ncbi:MAG: DUF3293 domain-containing protein [Chloroflexi bacterium]|nr:DUF3293 domain-containing protein [Chloroflexota bacterium]
MTEPAPVPPGLAQAYAEALYQIHHPAGDMLFSMKGFISGKADLVRHQTYTVVTAYNPGTEQPNEAVNQAAHRRLVAYVEEHGWTAHPAAGFSPDRSHLEPSLAIAGLSRLDAAAVGARFQQAAVFYWDGVQPHLVWCMPDAPVP